MCHSLVSTAQTATKHRSLQTLSRRRAFTMASRSCAFLLSLLLPGLLSVSQGCQEPMVNLQQGPVRGRWVVQPHSELRNYYAFEGIPYARPPVGERRFKDPEEPESWHGIKNATTAGSICIQKNLLTQELSGDEDCLFINVYTAHPSTSWIGSKYPVVVWIHPGAFNMGWGHMDILRPDDMIRHGLVVVSFNYRLGVLGFLNTEDTNAPGNAGLKDAVMALKWVKNNIAAFGGDPENVTVVGEGAGGAIVHYLLLAPQLTDGLIHRAVSMSGSALAPWAMVERPREHAAALRAQLAALCPDTDDAIVPCLQSVDAAELVRSQETASPPELALRFWRGRFLPSVEAPAAGPHPFLRADPTQLMREGRFLKVPYITGFTSAEGIMVVSLAQLIANPEGWTDVDRRLEDVFRPEMPPGLRQQLAVRQMRHFYLGEGNLRADDTEAVRGFVQMCTDVFVAVPTVSTARLMAQGGATVYVYEFAHEGHAPWLKTSVYNASNVAGVAHGDDLAYLFQHAQPGQPPAADPDDEAAVRNKRVRHLANFAKTANPTPRLFGKPKWRVYTPSEESYLKMNTSFTAHDHVLGERINFWRQLAKCQSAETCELNPVVRVAQGLVKGRRQESVANCTYFSWQGIPYAKPPLGSLRFKDAVTPEPWERVRDALQDGNNCPQISGDTVAGNEDCLFVNVHVPRRPSWLADSFPVMLWVHGGGFVTGSGDATGVGPDYLICEDIIFVSLNYRLGVLGFLYLEAASPGNVGLKDQVFAERWVQANIAAFGGDPGRITLAGESAGSASVHLQMLSPMTHGLFQQAIAQSGAALNPWAIQTTPVQTALNLAAALNCSADVYAAVVECLRGVSADALVKAAENDAPTQVDQNRMVSFTFVPTPDYPVEGVETFLPAPVNELVTNNSHHAVPYLTGFNTQESILQLLNTNFRDPLIAELVDATWKLTILPDLRVPSNSSQVNEALQALRQFFMNGKPLSNGTFFQFMDMLTDIGFAEGIYKSVRHMAVAAKAPIHLYSFGIDDALNFLKINFNITDVPGAAHADDLGYLFRIAFLHDVPANSSAALGRRRMVKMWTNYVKTGDPTPTYDPLIGTRWRPYTNDTRNYLDITSQLEAKTDLNDERVDFWEQFYRTYANETY